MTDGDLAAFDAAWDRFASWLSARCPIDHVALRSPATAEEIAALETRLGFPLHPQLRALLERHNGVIEKPEPDNFHAGAFLPLGHRLNDTEHIIRQHEWLVHERELIAVGQGEDDLYGHAHQWVPFAHPNDGGTAFVDHRPGPTYGHVYEMGIGSGADATKWASSLAELFDDLATSLDTGEPFRGSWPNPYELPSRHFCLSWDSSTRTKIASMQDWPPPRRLDSPLRPAATTGRGLGRRLGALIPPSAPRSPSVAAQDFDIPVGPFHTSGVIVNDSENPEDTNR
ncbi:SMI1/KNR4 family protein [Streptomyces hirsutus]|uniref:SMI1/KNR4 family protein n=1 Tax=Streptomyces hirsutus TaxID=35620 RepID=UPI0033BA67F5